MSFMEPEIFEDSYFEVDTSDGFEFVPCSVCGIYGRAVNPNELRDYLDHEPDPYHTPQMIKPKHGYVCRMSAAGGHPDATPWAGFPTEQQCKEYLDELYGDDDNRVFLE